jgi:tetratricopeptide (TPR) repeat protein
MAASGNTAHRAGTPCPDEARLGEYVDGVLTDRERLDVQAHLVDCAACRDAVADIVRMVGAPTLASSRRLWDSSWLRLSAAASLLIGAIYFLQPQRLLRSRGERVDLAALVAAAASAPTRPTDGLLTGFSYAPPPLPRRGTPALQPAAVRLAAARILRAAESRDRSNVEALAAAGVAHLALGDFDRAIDALEQATQRRPADARLQSDLSAAYLARAGARDQPDDWSRALAAGQRATDSATPPPEASFNRALALEGLHRDAEAADAWAALRRMSSAANWEAEMALHERAARARVRP